MVLYVFLWAYLFKLWRKVCEIMEFKLRTMVCPDTKKTEPTIANVFHVRTFVIQFKICFMQIRGINKTPARITFRTHPVIFRTYVFIYRTKPVIFNRNPSIFWKNPVIFRTNPVNLRQILIYL